MSLAETQGKSVVEDIIFRSVGPVPNTSASPSTTAATGVTCGRPSGRTVDNQ